MIKRLFFLSILLLLAACGGKEGLPTAVPTASLPQNTDAQGSISIPEAVPTGELAPLPPLAGVVGSGVSGGNAPVSEGDTAVGVVVADPFAQTTFTLNADLPAEPAEAAVLRQTPSGELTPDAARQLANRFGFTGELYRENIMADLASPALVLPTIYYAFDGTLSFNVSPWAANYQDSSAEYDPANPPDFAMASQTAVAFLEARGLLDFPYVVREGYNGDVMVLRQIEGRTLNQPEIVVGVSPEGVVSYVSYQVMPNPELVNTYPLIPATDAWARLQSGVAANNISSAIYPAAGTAVSTPLPAVQSWARPYAPGQTVQLYGWPNAYLPASGSGAARVQLYPFQLAGDEEVINQMAAAAGQQITVEGVIGDDGRTVTVNNWSVSTLEPLTLQGVLRRDGDRALLEATDGQTYQLPDAPAEIADGTELFVYAWNSQTAEDGSLQLQWERIDQANAAETTLPAAEAVATAYESATIDSVELAYYLTYLFPEGAAEGAATENNAPTILLQPAWRFAGTLNSGETVEFFVQAARN